MSFLNRLLVTSIESILKREGSYTVPGWYNNAKNYDKIFDEKLGIYQYQAGSGSSTVTQTLIYIDEDTKHIEIEADFVREQDVEKIYEEEGITLKNGIIVPHIYGNGKEKYRK